MKTLMGVVFLWLSESEAGAGLKLVGSYALTRGWWQGSGYSSMVEMSPGSWPNSLALSTRRMILPERVFGRD